MDQSLQGKENGLGLDSVIQGALAAGIPIPQVIQFIQSSFQNNQLQSFAQTPNQQLLAAVTNPAQLLNSSNASNVSGLGQLNAHSNLNFNLQALNQAQHQVHVASSQAPQSSLNSTINGAENGSLPWPIFQPAVHVPHFDMSTYQKVNLDAQASALPSGMDLPLHDMNTLRFFFNFGVHHARQILLREHFQLQPGQNHQQPTNSNVSVASQLGQQGQLMSSLSNQDLLYQQMLLKNSQDLTSGKPVGTPLPGSTSAVTDPRSAFQLQKDLANSILNKSQGLQIKNEPMENLLIQNSLLGTVSARGVNTSAPQSTPLAILQRQQQAAQQGHQTHNQQRNHNQEPEVLRPQPVSLSDLTGSVQIQQLLQQQNLGGIGLSFQQPNKTLTAQVPVDPAPRPSVPSRDQDTGGVALTTSAGSTFPQKDAQDQADRMKPTAIVRGAVADVASRSQNSPPKGNEANSSNQTPNNHSNGTPSQSSAMSSSQDTAAVAVANALVSQFGGVNGQVPSLAAQLSAAMVASTFMNPSKLPATSAASSNPLVNDNPDAHLLAGTSPYAKFPALAQSATRSLTSGNSGLTGESNNHSNNSELSEIKPESILQTSEQHFTEAFKRSLQQQMHGKNGKGGSPKGEPAESPDRVQRKSGVNLMSLEKEAEKKKSADKPIPSMINYVNSCLTQIKSQVQSQGVGLPIDHNGRPIDYSSRPIDPIFRQAREKLEKDRDFSMIRRGSPSLHPPTTTQSPVDSCPIGISDSRSRSEQPQDIQQKVATLSPANSQRPRSTQPGAEGALQNNNEDGPSESKKIKVDAPSSESS
ncbi:unnamed protein product [Bursaphelenchus xylophilus]|uniref:(pine wood nematode) hypothetical protein n=1 Tax=Bursaphelenchus xylophilus TaxID=6326 RepID=A0A1I7RR47_BURXY|nr:unnamed protein product [Bursaphelenchus xylophilus]CAG9130838.1 unnamed protein product [Bursaphelenchus xylophilus]